VGLCWPSREQSQETANDENVLSLEDTTGVPVGTKSKERETSTEKGVSGEKMISKREEKDILISAEGRCIMGL